VKFVRAHVISYFHNAKQRRTGRVCCKTALMLHGFKMSYLALPRSWEPVFLLESGWQIHHNKVRRPEETAHYRNEPIAARRSPGSQRERMLQWLGGQPSWVLFAPCSTNFPLQSCWKTSASHLRFAETSRCLLISNHVPFPNPEHAARLIFLKQSCSYAISMLRSLKDYPFLKSEVKISYLTFKAL
jgi:hypothetical protein